MSTETEIPNGDATADALSLEARDFYQRLLTHQSDQDMAFEALSDEAKALVRPTVEARRAALLAEFKAEEEAEARSGRVKFRAKGLRENDEAKALAEEFKAEERVAELPDFRKISLTSRIKAPRTIQPVVIGNVYTGIIARHGHIIRNVADSKAGKTTNGLNFLRTSLTGEPFLGFFPVVPVEKNEDVAFVDPELGEDALDYLSEAMAGQPDSTVDRVRHIDVKSAGGIDLRYGADRTWLSQQMEGCGRALLDSILDMISGFNPNDDAEVRALFKWLEEIKANSGVREVLVNVHMNRNKDERSFGAAAWEGKFQSLWGSYKEDAEGTGHARRFFRVEEGRKTGPFPETEVTLDADGRPVLSEIGVGRRQAKEARYDNEATLTAITNAVALWVGKCTDGNLKEICEEAALTDPRIHVGLQQVKAVGALGIERGVLTNTAYTLNKDGVAIKTKGAHSDWKIVRKEASE